MPWGRLHDRAGRDEKLLALSDPAWRMWGCGIIYCQDKLTDGFIPDSVIHTFGVRQPNKLKVAAELCRSLVPGKGPLWHKVDGGYQVHDYLDWNDSREDILKARRQGRDRSQRHRDRQRDHGSHGPIHSDSHAVTSGVTNTICDDERNALRNDVNTLEFASRNAERGGKALPRTTIHEIPSARTAPSAPLTLSSARKRALAREPNGDNVGVLHVLARDLLASADFEDEIDLGRALKDACRDHDIEYGGSHPAVSLDVVQRVADAVWQTRSRRPA